MSVRPSVRPSVRRSVTLELKSGKTHISAPAHPSASGGRVSGLVILCSFVLVLLVIILVLSFSFLVFVLVFVFVRDGIPFRRGL